MDDTNDLSLQSSVIEIVDDINKSLSAVCLDDTENDQASDTESASQFCSSTPIRTNRKQHCHKYDKDSLREIPCVDLCTSSESSEVIAPVAKDSDFIDVSMYTLSIAECEETRNDFEDNSLCNDSLPVSQQLTNRKGEDGIKSADIKETCLKSNDGIHTNIIVQSNILNEIHNMSTDLKKHKPSLNIIDKNETKQKQNVLNSVLLKSSKNKFVAEPSGSMMENPIIHNQELESHSFQPCNKKGQTETNNRKQMRRKKFLHDKQKKKLAASRSTKHEEKENKLPEPIVVLEPVSVDALCAIKQDQNICTKSARCALQVIQDWIGDAPPEKKDGDKKVEEFVSDDQNENLDINDPDWDNIKCLETDEERYKAVKACWKSKIVPNPQRDLTFYLYRHKRLKAITPKPLCNKKRVATNNLECALTTKMRKLEEAPCTFFLDRKITDAKKQFTNQQHDHVISFLQEKDNLNKGYYRRNRDIMNEYHKEVNHIKCMTANCITREWLLMSLDKWLNTQKMWLHESFLNEKERVKKQEDKILDSLKNNYTFTMKKLVEAKNEVLKFNQFYYGLNRIDPTVLRGQFLDEIVALEDMYLTYEKYYGFAH